MTMPPTMEGDGGIVLYSQRSHMSMRPGPRQLGATRRHRRAHTHSSQIPGYPCRMGPPSIAYSTMWSLSSSLGLPGASVGKNFSPHRLQRTYPPPISWLSTSLVSLRRALSQSCVSTCCDPRISRVHLPIALYSRVGDDPTLFTEGRLGSRCAYAFRPGYGVVAW